jgi:hypothetical protein
MKRRTVAAPRSSEFVVDAGQACDTRPKRFGAKAAGASR